MTERSNIIGTLVIRGLQSDFDGSLRSYKIWNEFTKTYPDYPPTSDAYREQELGPDRSCGAQRHVTNGDTFHRWFISLHDFRHEAGLSMPSQKQLDEIRQFNQGTLPDFVPRREGMARPVPVSISMGRGDHQSLVFGWSDADASQGEWVWKSLIRDISLEEGTVPAEQSERIRIVRETLSEMVSPDERTRWQRERLGSAISPAISNTVKSQLDTIANMLVRGVEADRPMTGMVATGQATSAEDE